MTRTVVAVLAIALFLPLTAQAGEWTAEQKEVWEFEKACWEAKEAETLTACFHEDYKGWVGNIAVLVNKADRRLIFTRQFETSETVFLFLKPLSIQIHGNMAIALYVSGVSNRNKETGKETTSSQRWTDVLLKDGETWKFITDHARPIGDN